MHIFVTTTMTTKKKKGAPTPGRLVCACFLAQPVRELVSPALDDAGANREIQAVVVGVM